MTTFPGLSAICPSPHRCRHRKWMVRNFSLTKGPTVREIQRKLKEKKFMPGDIDGDFGPNTHAAVVSFQASRGLLIDCEVGATTARVLGVKLRGA